MRRVKLEERPVESIYLSDITNSDIIGIEFGSGRKSIPVQISSSKWVSSEVGAEVKESSFVKITGSSLPGLLANLQTDKKVFVFETRNELLEWLKN